MRTLHFRARISKNGTIRIPEGSSLIDTEVEVIIVPQAKSIDKKIKAKKFVEKWAGFLHPLKSGDPKYDYLTEKHQ